MMVTEKEPENKEVEGREEEIDGLRRENETLRAEAESARATVARMESELAAKDAETASVRESVEETARALEEKKEQLTGAVAAYRELVAETNPGLPEEMITGQTIGEVRESVEKARALMARVRQEMETEAARTRIPAGAPPRTPPDLSGLSPREKIQYAIGGDR